VFGRIREIDRLLALCDQSNDPLAGSQPNLAHRTRVQPIRRHENVLWRGRVANIDGTHVRVHRSFHPMHDNLQRLVQVGRGVHPFNDLLELG
jgi:hypothetical protein